MPKKGKQWSKLDTSAEQLVLEDRSSDLSVRSMPDSELFAVDTVGHVNSIRNRKRRAADALSDGNVKRYRVYDSDDEVDGAAVAKAAQKTRESLRKKPHNSLGNRERRPRQTGPKVHAELQVLKPVDTSDHRGEAVVDLWDVDPSLLSSALTSSQICTKTSATTVLRAHLQGYEVEQRQGLAQNTLYHRPDRSVPSAPSSATAMSLPHPGQSFNPDASSHSELLNFVCAIALFLCLTHVSQ